MEAMQNDFVTYLNSMHSLGASGANALAESQALSPFFGELYEPLPLIDDLVNSLKAEVDRVVILTGHAGDGKSTVALDVFKKLQGLPALEPLDTPISECEVIDDRGGSITIVKDMSEQSAERRVRLLGQAFSEPGSWLIISNTGPLLHSLSSYAEDAELGPGVEKQILKHLDQPLSDGFDQNRLETFGKELLILNLTRWDNVAIGAKLLTKLVGHSGWDGCDACSIKPDCPVRQNQQALLGASPTPEQRVRWIYRVLSSYEHRLTLRQIVAQLAFSLTGGMSCGDAHQQFVNSATAEPNRAGSALEPILFSETFFGYRSGKPSPDAEGMLAIALVRRLVFGGPVGVNFERKLLTEPGIGWANLPPPLDALEAHWRSRAAEASSVRWRFAMRRMAYLFGTVADSKETDANIFLDTFLQSPGLREFDQWQQAESPTQSPREENRLRRSCLRVLLEVFSGFSASQFHSNHETLYLTLRRADTAVMQPTQMVLETLAFRDFDLSFDPSRRLPVLGLTIGGESAELYLTLPLLDYMRRRDAGELGNALSPIHQAQLHRFRAELLAIAKKRKHRDGEVDLLRTGIDGEVHLHRFLLDQDQGILEPN